MMREQHWNRVYDTKESDAVSWYQSTPVTSLRLLDAAGLNAGSCVIDVGGGDARLVDALLAREIRCVYVLDVSFSAIARARSRLPDGGPSVKWIVADVTADWPVPQVDFWHDRAVFHFLVDADDRERYIANLRKALKLGGYILIATFAPDGPTKCSGLPVVRYSRESLIADFGGDFEPEGSLIESHVTPIGTRQPFLYALFRRIK